MGVVSFRISDEDDHRLRAAGIHPAALAKRVVEEEARRVDARETFARLARLARTPSKPAEAIIRELRDRG